MIGNYKHKGLQQFATTGDVTRIQTCHAARLAYCLHRLQTAKTIRAISGVIHKMTDGSALEGFYAMKVSAQWRLVFKIDDFGNYRDLDYINYHH